MHSQFPVSPTQGKGLKFGVKGMMGSKGGGWWWWLNVILMLSLCLGQADQRLILNIL